MNRLSPDYLTYAMFERTRRGKYALFPLGIYQRVATALNRRKFETEIAESRSRYEQFVAEWGDLDSAPVMEDGWCRLDASAVPEAPAALARCQDLVAERGRRADQRLNPYGIATRDELLEDPAIHAFLNSPTILAAACRYLGTHPFLSGVDLLESRPRGDGLQGSQNYHVDNIARRVVRLVLHVSDVAAENGPFTFHPAGASEELTKKLRYFWRLDYAEIGSDEVDGAAGGRAPVEVTGSAGTILLVDTCNCLHFGSRVQEGFRHVLMASYVAHPFTNVRWLAGLH